MFPSPPNSDTHSFFNSNQNPNSTSTSSLLFNFPPPFLEDQDSPLNQIFSKTHDHMESQIEHTLAEMPTPRSLQGVAPRRGPGKKDRHSKICTAQGVRDRRMRLSLQVARKFFDLQDMLGHDKASKTIDWLLKQSENAIDELRHQPAGEAKSESFVVSECDEDTSETSDSSKTADADALTPPKSNARKSRDKARARARRRTREKMVAKLNSSGDFFEPNPSNNDNEGIEQEMNPNIDGIMASPYNSIQQQLSDVGTIERFLEKSSSDYCCADPNSSSLMGFLGNWDVVSSDRPNCFDYSDTNQVSFAGNLNSANAEFP